MSHQIATSLLSSGTAVESKPTHGSAVAAWFKRALKAHEVAQQARADRLVRPYLTRQSDETLKSLGFTAEKIAAIRNSKTF